MNKRVYAIGFGNKRGETVEYFHSLIFASSNVVCVKSYAELLISISKKTYEQVLDEQECSCDSVIHIVDLTCDIPDDIKTLSLIDNLFVNREIKIFLSLYPDLVSKVNEFVSKNLSVVWEVLSL